MSHAIERVRHDLVRRSVIVRDRTLITPHMVRLTFAGDELAGFKSLAPDDHIKVFVPGPDGEVARRDYTPRRYDAEKGELIVDFALHEGGPVTTWARAAKPGDVANIGGPRGSVIVPDDFDWWLLIGDETALPAIGRRIEDMSAGTPVTSIVAVASRDEEQRFATAASHQAIWVHRPAHMADDAESLLAAVRAFTPPPGDGFVWIAAEAGVARALRTYVEEELRHPTAWLKASGYWVKGQADASDKM